MFAQTHHALHLDAAGRGHGDDDHVRLFVFRKRKQVIDGVQYGKAMNLRAHELRIIVQKAERKIRVVVQHIAHEFLAGTPRPKYQHALARASCHGKYEAVILPHPVDHAGCTEQDHEDERVKQQRQTRHALQPVEQKQGEADRKQAERDTAHDIPQIGHARKTPDTSINAHPPQHQPLRHDHQRQHTQGIVPESSIREVGAQQRGETPSQRHHDKIMYCHRRAAASGDEHEAAVSGEWHSDVIQYAP